jgi:hypothetical protein
MSLVRFATICDHCARRSDEYARWPICRDCLADTCPDCMAAGTEDQETGKCYCKGCVEEFARNYPDPMAARSVNAALAVLAMAVVAWLVWTVITGVHP